MSWLHVILLQGVSDAPDVGRPLACVRLRTALFEDSVGSNNSSSGSRGTTGATTATAVAETAVAIATAAGQSVSKSLANNHGGKGREGLGLRLTVGSRPHTRGTHAVDQHCPFAAECMLFRRYNSLLQRKSPQCKGEIPFHNAKLSATSLCHLWCNRVGLRSPNSLYSPPSLTCGRPTSVPPVLDRRRKSHEFHALLCEKSGGESTRRVASLR